MHHGLPLGIVPLGLAQFPMTNVVRHGRFGFEVRSRKRDVADRPIAARTRIELGNASNNINTMYDEVDDDDAGCFGYEWWLMMKKVCWRTR